MECTINSVTIEFSVIGIFRIAKSYVGLRQVSVQAVC